MSRDKTFLVISVNIYFLWNIIIVLYFIIEQIIRKLILFNI